MRVVVAALPVLLLLAACKRAPEKPAETGPAHAVTPPRTKMALFQGDGGTGAVPSVPEEVKHPGVPVRARIDCSRLLSAERASEILGTKVVFTGATPTAATECQWARSATDLDHGMLDVVVMCEGGAVRMYLNIRRSIAAGDPEVRVGHKAVLLRGKDQSEVQFVDERSPCAAEVTTVPGDKAVEAAREVAKNLSQVVAGRR